MNKTLAFVIHHRAYRENDLIIQLLTEQYGLISAVLKGGRANNQVSQQQRANLQLATLLEVQLKLSTSSLSSLIQVDSLSITPPLSTFAFVYVGYINEISRLYLTEGQNVSFVFSRYQQSILCILGAENEELSFRLLELELIKASSLAWSFDIDVSGLVINEGKRYHFIFDQGMIIAETNKEKSYSGKFLLALHNGHLRKEDQLKAKLFFRKITQQLFPNVHLKSREFFLKLKK